jgi:hypothetical protein
MYAEPARTWLEAHGGSVVSGASAKVRIDANRVVAVDANGQSWTSAAVVASVPWFAFADLFDAVPPSLAKVADAAARTAPSPIVTVNLWFDRTVIDEPFIGLPGRAMQWVFDKRTVFGSEASHLSLVSSGAASIVAMTNDQLIARPIRSCSTSSACPDLQAAARHRRARTARDFFAGAGRTAAAGRVDRRRWFCSGRRLDRYRTSRDYRRRGAVGTRRRRSSNRMPLTSVVVHYKELSLKGRNRPWFVQMLVQNIKRALRGLHVRSVRSIIGRIEIELASDPARARPRARTFARGWAACSALRISRSPAAVLTISNNSPVSFSTTSEIGRPSRFVCRRGAPTSAFPSPRRRSSAKWGVGSRMRKAGAST